jgi:hypothetical protein
VDEMRSSRVLHKDIDTQERIELLRTYYQSQGFATAFTRRYCMDEHGQFQNFARVAYQSSPPRANQPGQGAPGTEMFEKGISTTVKLPTDAGKTLVEESEISSEAGEATTGSSVTQLAAMEDIEVRENGAATFAQAFKTGETLRKQSIGQSHANGALGTAGGLPIRLALRGREEEAGFRVGDKREADAGFSRMAEHSEAAEEVSGVHEYRRRRKEKLANVTIG